MSRRSFVAKFAGTCPRCGRQYPKGHKLSYAPVDGKDKPVCAESSCAKTTPSVSMMASTDLVEVRIARVLKFWLEHIDPEFRRSLADRAEMQVRIEPGTAVFFSAPDDLFSIPLDWLLDSNAAAPLPNLSTPADV